MLRKREREKGRHAHANDFLSKRIMNSFSKHSTFPPIIFMSIFFFFNEKSFYLSRNISRNWKQGNAVLNNFISSMSTHLSSGENYLSTHHRIVSNETFSFRFSHGFFFNNMTSISNIFQAKEQLLMAFLIPFLSFFFVSVILFFFLSSLSLLTYIV